MSTWDRLVQATQTLALHVRDHADGRDPGVVYVPQDAAFGVLRASMDRARA